jgi:GNAT superfamily N-acetyltransferase
VPRPQVVVRRAEVQDVDDLLLMWARAREDLSRTVRNLSGTSVEQVRPRLHEALDSASVGVLIAYCDDAPAGYVVVAVGPVNPLFDGVSLHVEHMYVAPEFRRRGVARALLTKVTAVAETSGCEQVIANVTPQSRDTQRFLARLGFAPLAVRRVVPTAALRRRLSGQTGRGGLEDLLSRRRSQRARAPRLPPADDVAGAAGATSASGNLAWRSDDVPLTGFAARCPGRTFPPANV